MKMKARNKILLLALCMAALIAVSVIGTMAYLTSTAEVTNTFTVGDISIDLYEHNYIKDSNTLGTTEVNSVSDYKILPGVDLPKDPTVKVTANSEPCWLFIKIEDDKWPTATGTDGKKKINYELADGWTPLDEHSGVYYKELSTETTDKTYPVIKDNKVTVSSELTKGDIDSFKNTHTDGTFTLKITAYAIQKDNTISSATIAWDTLMQTYSNTNP